MKCSPLKCRKSVLPSWSWMLTYQAIKVLNLTFFFFCRDGIARAIRSRHRLFELSKRNDRLTAFFFSDMLLLLLTTKVWGKYHPMCNDRSLQTVKHEQYDFPWYQDTTVEYGLCILHRLVPTVQVRYRLLLESYSVSRGSLYGAYWMDEWIE